MASILYGVPQASILGPLLFLIYVNYLDQTIKSCEVHHFADNTNLLHFSTHVTRLNKYLSFDMNNLSYWLDANKISLHVQKSKLLIYTQKKLVKSRLSFVENDSIPLTPLNILELELMTI